jgi:uncharacterized protein (DUF3820 family)
MYTDKTIMTFGKHKGKALANVPGEWFIWLWEESGQGIRIYDKQLKAYIVDNMQAFKMEGKKHERR